MDLLNLINLRQSVRKYTDKPVEREKLDRCLEALRLSPSAHNAQPWKIIVADQEPLRTDIAQATFSPTVQFNRFTLKAPLLIIILLNKPTLLVRASMRLKKRDWQLIDIGIAAENFCLQATEEGLGTCMMGWYNEKKIKEILEIPPDKSVALLISVGYAEDGYPLRKKNRFPVEQVVSYNHL